MTGVASTTVPRPTPGGKAGWVHFAIAAGVLLIAAIGWNWAKTTWRWYMVKLPVPWPATVSVSECRLTSFPDKVGPYALAPQVDKAWRDADGQTDGVEVLREDVQENLGVTAHPLDWYYMACYGDTRKPGKFFRLSVTYYTGLLDAVPHISERCLWAAGFQQVPEDSGTFRVTVPQLAAPWNEFKVYRTVYVPRESGGRKAAEYHVFSVNGRPEAQSESVRWELSKLTVKYCYFAKIQVSPPRSLLADSLAGSDADVQDFLREMLPAVLRYLPSAADVDQLHSSGGSAAR